MPDGRIKPKRATVMSARQMLDRWVVRGRMTQTEAAAHIGISRIKLNQYLHGEARPSLETAIRIEDATGIGMRAWLVDDDPGAAADAPDVAAETETGDGTVTDRNERESESRR